MTLLHELEVLRDVLRESLDDAPAYSRAPLARELRAVVTQIDEMGIDSGTKVTGLSEFEKRLRERESGPKAPRRAKSG